MSLSRTEVRQDLRQAFQDYNRDFRISNSRVGAMLVVVLVPMGASLDYFVYPEHLGFFFSLRVMCSVLALAVWALLKTAVGRRHYRILGMAWCMLPLFFISLMIYFSEGVASPYYAGLNLVLVGISWVAQVDFWESLTAVLLTIVMYLLACLFNHNAITLDNMGNNMYFIVTTGVLVVTGNYFLNRLRAREFELRAEVDQSRRDLELSNKKLIDMDRAKTDFFANISHELRTPLTLLVGPLDKLRNRTFPPEPLEQNELLDIMYNNAMRLLRLINDLLNLVKIDSGTLKLSTEKTELEPFLRGIANSVLPMAQERKLEFETSIHLSAGQSAFLDRDKVEKIILNLLFNAFKFTPSGGSVELRAVLEGDFLSVDVKDTGKGIAREELPKIFDRFWQAEAAATRRYQGVGIGLALVRELTQLHGGTAVAESSPGEGTIMHVRLNAALPPREYETDESEHEPEVQTEEWLTKLYRRAELFPSHVLKGEAPGVQPGMEAEDSTPLVLVADDEPEMRRFLKSQLQSLFRVHEAVDGIEALKLAKENDYSLMLVDYMMPGKDGMEVLKDLRAESGTRTVPVIILTARADDDSKMKALELGATDFLTKPFASTELMVRSKNLVFSHQLQIVLGDKTKKLEQALDLIKQTETQLVQQAKMATLGQLSAGLMHEINNPLNFANTAFHLLKKRMSKLPQEGQETLTKPLQDIQDGIQRVAAIVSSLRGFSHPNDTAMGPVDLAEAVQTAIRFVRIDSSEIALELDIAGECRVWGNTNQLIQIFVNLLQNSADSLREKNGDNKKITVKSIGRDGKWRLGFFDNGKGIPAENLTKIFDAFYTTKDVGSGVGLGLSICQQIAQQHQGNLEVDSKVGDFCCFTLVLPKN